MKSHVSFRQAAEGRKLEILLSPESLAALNSGSMHGVELSTDNCVWEGEGRVSYRNESGESFAIATITLGIRYGDESSEGFE